MLKDHSKDTKQTVNTARFLKYVWPVGLVLVSLLFWLSLSLL